MTIEDGASIFGRTPNFLTDKIGVLSIIIFMVFGAGVLVFSLFGINNVGSVTVFAILYGLFSGGSLLFLMCGDGYETSITAVLAVFAPVLAFIRDKTESPRLGKSLKMRH